jgi:GT2 family glycosyltransferase
MINNKINENSFMTKLNPLDHPVCFSAAQRLILPAWQEHIPFAMFLIDLLRPKTIVELGTHCGDSYCAFCQAVAELHLETKCYAVDTWQGDPQAGYYGPEVLVDLRAHHDRLYGNFSCLLQCTFDEALKKFEDNSIDLLHIDGCHTYEAIKHDFESWLPKLNQSGIVLLHDITEVQDNFGARKFWQEVSPKYRHFEFTHSHGLGILAKERVDSPELRTLFDLSEEQTGTVRSLFWQLGRAQSLTGENTARMRELKEKDTQNAALHTSKEEMAAQIAAKDKELGVKDRELATKDSELDTKDAEIALLKRRTSEMTLLEAHKARLEAETQRLQNLLLQVQSGILMGLLRRYTHVIDKCMPWGTRRRGYYELGIAGIRVLINEGPQSFWRNYKRYRNRGKIIPTKVDRSSLSILTTKVEEIISVIDKQVTVVIPTKDAGSDFDFTLERIKSTKGIADIDIVVVDSGSTDGTVALTQKYGARVFSVRPDEFNHGLTRNFGAAQGAGDYVLFMVQDAIPIGDRWLHDMVMVLESDPLIAAATCRQVPRSDADLFACFSLWNHNRVLGRLVDSVTPLPQKLHGLDPLEKRKLAGIDDVCCLMRRDVFNNLKFRDVLYAEDLDLGLRILDEGLQNAFLGSVGIIHSHNREAAYILKRTYIESKLLPGILGYIPTRYPDIGHNIIEVMANIRILYVALSSSLLMMKVQDHQGGVFLSEIIPLIEKNTHSNIDIMKHYENISGQLDGFLDAIWKEFKQSPIKPSDFILRYYLNSINELASYMRERDSIDSRRQEMVDSLYKLYAVMAGSILANHFLTRSKDSDDSTVLSSIDDLLSRGV